MICRVWTSHTTLRWLSLQVHCPRQVRFLRHSPLSVRNKMSATHNISAEASEAMGKEFIEYNEQCPTPFHSVEAMAKQLEEQGFQKLSERNKWDLQPLGKYYVVRNQGTICAFALGGNFVPGNGATICAAHTDSPCLKVKPVSKIDKFGYCQVGVETYGGLLAHTWFDRDLSVAGRVVVDDGSGKYQSKLVRIPEPILRIPNVAIHLQTSEERSAFKVNKEDHLAAVLSTAAYEELVGAEKSPDANHHGSFVQRIAKELDVSPGSIRDFELHLFDTQPGSIGGLHKEFVFAPRLDNQVSCFASLKALTSSIGSGSSFENDKNARVIACFDHEEVGSRSIAGAGSNLLSDVMSRINKGDAELKSTSIRRSILVSADNAHAVHPNYPSKHESNHRPQMHSGIVVKVNANQSYSTNSSTSFLFCKIAEEVNAPYQKFVVRQDMGCGSTIGPILSTGLGMRTIDVGVPQLSMHSVREQCGTSDLVSTVRILENAYNRFPELDEAFDQGE